jgi:hypothetical protein
MESADLVDDPCSFDDFSGDDVVSLSYMPGSDKGWNESLASLVVDCSSCVVLPFRLIGMISPHCALFDL